MNEEDISLQRLTNYQVAAVNSARGLVGFDNLDVLEVGGCLDRDVVTNYLGVRSWVALENYEYWMSLASSEPRRIATDERMGEESVSRMEACDDPASLHPYGIILGKIEEIPTCFHAKFDRIFSSACFEHIHRMQTALDAMYECLKPGGLAFSYFAPIWSSHNGHHLPITIDSEGREWGFGDQSNPLPPWAHLVMTPPEMQKHLEVKMDRATASEIVYHVYHNMHINRFFAEDYIEFFNQSEFVLKHLKPFSVSKATESTMQFLKRLHPDRGMFEYGGLSVVLEKPSGDH